MLFRSKLTTTRGDPAKRNARAIPSMPSPRTSLPNPVWQGGSILIMPASWRAREMWPDGSMGISPEGVLDRIKAECAKPGSSADLAFSNGVTYQIAWGISGTGYATPKRQRRSDRKGRTQNRSTEIGNTGSRDSRPAFLAASDIPHACGELASRLFFW